jgi:2-hydroxychromene-2-carboxylate isomerase
MLLSLFEDFPRRGKAVIAVQQVARYGSILRCLGGSVGIVRTPRIRALGDRMPRQVDYYFSFQSPWAYIGHKSFRDLANTHSLKVVYKPVVLVDLFAETGGLPLLKRHPVRQRYRMVELQRWRDRRGLNFHLQPANWPFNARLADGVVIAAVEAGLDPDGYLQRSFAGVWEGQLDLADPATVTKLADDSGLAGKQLVARSTSEPISAAYEQNRQDALAADVFGSPAYVLDGEVFWGQDRIELLADALKSGRAAYSSRVQG